MQAPGKSFREGITLAELFKMFPDNKTAEAWFESRIWKDGRICPTCKNPDTTISRHDKMPYYCYQCRSFFSVKKGTVMEASKLGYQKWAIATYLFATNLKGVSSVKLHRDLGVTQKTAWFMVHRLRESWKNLAGVDKMDGPVEIDEAFFGGLEKNKHKNKKGKDKKTAVVGAKDRKTNKVTATTVPETTKARLTDFIDNNVNENSVKYTDENPSYSDLSNHETVNHSVGQYVNGMAHTNGLESFWADMKRGYHGVFHHISQEHLHRYVNEFAGRHNIRSDTTDMMELIAENMSGERLKYRWLVNEGVLANKNMENYV